MNVTSLSGLLVVGKNTSLKVIQLFPENGEMMRLALNTSILKSVFAELN